MENLNEKKLIELRLCVKGVMGRDRKEKSHSFIAGYIPQTDLIDDARLCDERKNEIVLKLEKFFIDKKFKSYSRVTFHCEYITNTTYKHDDGTLMTSTMRQLFDDRNLDYNITPNEENKAV
jgi:hypothetical protein